MRTCDFLPAYLHRRPSTAVTGKSPFMIFWNLLPTPHQDMRQFYLRKQGSPKTYKITSSRIARDAWAQAEGGRSLGRVRLLDVAKPLADGHVAVVVAGLDLLHRQRQQPSNRNAHASRR